MITVTEMIRLSMISTLSETIRRRALAVRHNKIKTTTFTIVVDKQTQNRSNLTYVTMEQLKNNALVFWIPPFK